jgi:hypothetical protein
MRSSNLIAITVLVLVGCGEDPEVVSVSEEPVLWAACAAASECPVSENCFDTAGGGDPGVCFQLCNDGGSNCTSPQQCTTAKPYCCRSVACIQNAFSDPNARNFYVAGIQSGCHTDVSCEACPPGKVRNLADPGNPACCTPVSGCGGRQCGPTFDSCGWPQASCGTCPANQTCTSSGCCRRSQAEVCFGRCGTVSDGCGGTYSCGGCNPNSTCNAGGTCSCSAPYRNCDQDASGHPLCQKNCN